MTQIWFLPSGVGQLLEHVKPAMIARIRANPILAQFATLTLDSGMGDISKIVANAVVDAKEQGKRGLILLTGNVGSLGVSLPEVDVAFMLHDIESADMNYQQMMRVLTEMMNKKYGIVVDFNVWRILSTLNTYATSRCGQVDRSSADRIQWCVSNLIDVDPDLWECAESPETFPQEKIAEELTKQWRRMQSRSATDSSPFSPVRCRLSLACVSPSTHGVTVVRYAIVTATSGDLSMTVAGSLGPRRNGQPASEAPAWLATLLYSSLYSCSHFRLSSRLLHEDTLHPWQRSAPLR
jgi:hypothetical protein